MMEKTPHAPNKQVRTLLILSLIFLVFVIFVFLTQRKEPINWIEDYEVGVQRAKQQNKPVLLAFYKSNARFSEEMAQNVYVNPDVIKYVEKNFVPVFIDVDKHPDIARRYSVDYYPTHYVKRPDSDELFGPLLGYKTPRVFIGELGRLLKEAGAAGK